MKTRFTPAVFATATVLGFGIGPALAGNSQSGYLFPGYRGGASERQAPVTSTPTRGGISNFGIYLTESGHGTWLFPPDSNG